MEGSRCARAGGRSGASSARSAPRVTRRAALLALLLATIIVISAPRPALAATPLIAYRGLGTWVDLYDQAWKDAETATAAMAVRAVRTVYVETSNYRWPQDVNDPAGLSALITAAHAHGLRVVAWYLPGFADLGKDLRRSLAAVRFRTPGGQRFDSFALDVEASVVKPASTRTARLLLLSQRLRSAVGRAYPLGAITPSPVGMKLHADYWPDFPFRELAGLYDVMLPMGYYTYHGDGYARAYSETWQNIRIVREQTGKASFPIHIIGGLAAQSSALETLAFVRCVRLHGVLGASLYDYETTGAGDWQYLRLVPANPRQTPALPAAVGYGYGLGNIPRRDRSHPKEVFFDAGRLDTAQVLRYRLYDAQAGEVHLLVDWHDLGALPAGPGGRWSAERTVSIPARYLSTTRATIIGFVARGAFPRWRVWGVCVFGLTPAP